MNIQSMFFDRKAVLGAMDRATRRVLSRFGAYVRTTARRSIRRRKRPSQPGRPPSNRTGLLKKFIYFGYDPSEKSVVIGPVRLNRSIGDIPAVLEYGGKSQRIESRRGRWKKRSIRIQARPYMGPAFETEQSQLPALWKGSVR